MENFSEKKVKCIPKENLHPIVGHVCGKFNRLLLFWGGYYENAKRRQTFIEPEHILAYDTEIDKWFSFKTDGEIPSSNSGCCGVLCGSFWYICGGFFDHFLDSPTELYMLNLRTLHWTRLKPTNRLYPTPRNKFVGWEHGNKLYFFGGFGTMPNILTSGDEHSYLFCGGSFDQDNGSCYCWNNQLLSFDLVNLVWTVIKTKGSVPSSRAAHSAVKINDDTVILFGGRHLQHRLNDLYMLNLNTMTWTKIATKSFLPPCRSWHAMDAIDSKRVVLFGGFNQDCEPLRDIWILDTENFEWNEQSWEKRFLEPKLWHSGAVVDQNFYIFGGCKTNIFSDTEKQVFSNELVPIKFRPDSLLSLCACALLKCKTVNGIIPVLPTVLQKRLNAMLNDDDLNHSVLSPFDLLRVY